MRKFKKERGAISTLVLFTVLMFVIILLGVYYSINAKQKSQLESDMRIQKLYGADAERADQLYADYMVKANGVVSTYKIYYDSNSGEGTIEAQNIVKGDNFSVAGNGFNREGYDFIGWTTNADGTDDGYGWTNFSGTWNFANGEKGIRNNTLRLYAMWAKLYTLNIDGFLYGATYYNKTTSKNEINARYENQLTNLIDPEIKKPFARAKVTINGEVVAEDVTDFSQEIREGSTYKIEITRSLGYLKEGNGITTNSDPLTGTITKNTTVIPVYSVGVYNTWTADTDAARGATNITLNIDEIRYIKVNQRLSFTVGFPVLPSNHGQLGWGWKTGASSRENTNAYGYDGIGKEASIYNGGFDCDCGASINGTQMACYITPIDAGRHMVGVGYLDQNVWRRFIVISLPEEVYNKKIQGEI